MMYDKDKPNGMTKEEVKAYNKELCDRMPYLIPTNVWIGEVIEDYDYSYIRGDYELPPGWMKLFLQMCEDIREPLIQANYLEQFRFSQIKEKYGTMRCYEFGGPQEVHEILHKYEYVSQFICQECGAPARWETKGWVASYCTRCLKLVQILTGDCRRIKFKPEYRYTTYSTEGGEKKHYIDCSDIWSRLYEEEEKF